MNIPNADTYILFFDGCSKGNPGKAAAGAVIYRNQIEIYAQSGFVGMNATNNVAEYHGLLMGLQKATALNIKNITVKGDSMLIIKQLKGEFKVKSPAMIPLFEMAQAFIQKIDVVKYEHVYREYNKRADALANAGLLLTN